MFSRVFCMRKVLTDSMLERVRMLYRLEEQRKKKTQLFSHIEHAL